MVHDFDNGQLINNLGGGSGAWVLDANDRNQFCLATLDVNHAKGEKGFSLKVEYDLESPEQAQGGFWTQLLKRDLGKFDHLSFYVRRDASGGTSRFRIEFKKSKPDGLEKIVGSFLVEGVKDEWTEVQIPLNKMVGMNNWQGIEELVIVLKDRMVDQKRGILYFDDFKLIKTGNPGPSIFGPVSKKIAKPSDLVYGEKRAKLLISRLKGFPSRVIVQKKFPEDPKLFLKEMAKDTWGYFRDIVDKENGLPLDNYGHSKDAVMGDATYIGDYTNVTNIGLYLMCVVSAYDFGFIGKKEALDRIHKTLDTVEQLESYHGFLYNYYDTTTLERTSHLVSFVDEGWLTIGIIIAKNAFSEELKDRCEKLIQQRDFSFFYDAIEGQMFHGFFPSLGVYSEYHYGAFYTEPRAASFMAIGEGRVPEEHWFMMARTFPAEFAWQSQTPKNRFRKEILGYHVYEGYYLYRDRPHIPSWGGSMFEALMPAMILDEKVLAPEGLGLNDERHVQAQISYALEDLKYPVWGLSPSSVPPGNGYSEYGVPSLGMKPYNQNVVTPHATFLALEFAPKEAIQNLKKMLQIYPIYGEYGFYDAVNVKTGEISYKYLCLDQAMTLVSINNFLTGGAIRKRFMSDPIAQRAKHLLSAEKFFKEEE